MESEMTLSLLCILLSKVFIVAKLSSALSKPLVQLHCGFCFLALECFFFVFFYHLFISSFSLRLTVHCVLFFC